MNVAGESEQAQRLAHSVREALLRSLFVREDPVFVFPNKHRLAIMPDFATGALPVVPEHDAEYVDDLLANLAPLVVDKRSTGCPGLVLDDDAPADADGAEFVRGFFGQERGIDGGAAEASAPAELLRVLRVRGLHGVPEFQVVRRGFHVLLLWLLLCGVCRDLDFTWWHVCP